MADEKMDTLELCRKRMRQFARVDDETEHVPLPAPPAMWPGMLPLSSEEVRAVLQALDYASLDDGDGVQRIARERQRQKDVEGWTDAHDDKHRKGDLALAAACYAAPCAVYRYIPQPNGAVIAELWPWSASWDKRSERLVHPPMTVAQMQARIRDLEKSGALAAAEIDRLVRRVERIRQADQVSSKKERSCRSCKFWGADMDGAYCAAPEVLKVMPHGQSISGKPRPVECRGDDNGYHLWQERQEP